MASPAQRRRPPSSAGRAPQAKGASRAATALTIAGLDPSGGAGILADVRAFEAMGAFGLAVCTALTVQSTQGLVSVNAVEPDVVEAQLRALFADIEVGAVKVGAVGSPAIAARIADVLAEHPDLPVVVDPVIAATRSKQGVRLDGGAGVDALLARATLLTPNLHEAELLAGQTILHEHDARGAARALLERGPCAVLVKGGHLDDADEAVDWYVSRENEVRLAQRRWPGLDVHGTGCTLSSLIAGKLAMRRGKLDDRVLLAAVRGAQRALQRALAAPLTLGRGRAVLRVGSR